MSAKRQLRDMADIVTEEQAARALKVLREDIDLAEATVAMPDFMTPVGEGLTVEQLIEALTALPKDAPVHFSYSARDHWNTVLAPRVKEVREANVVNSAYHSMPALSDEDEEGESAVVLS